LQSALAAASPPARILSVIPKLSRHGAALAGRRLWCVCDFDKHEHILTLYEFELVTNIETVLFEPPAAEPKAWVLRLPPVAYRHTAYRETLVCHDNPFPKQSRRTA